MPVARPSTPVALRPVIEDSWIQSGLVSTCADTIPFQRRAHQVIAAGLGQRGRHQHLCISAMPGLPSCRWVTDEIRTHATRSGLGDVPVEHLSVVDFPTLFGYFEPGAGSAPLFVPGAIARAGRGWLLLDIKALFADDAATAHLERCLAGGRIVWAAPSTGLPGWVAMPPPQPLEAQLILLGSAADIDELQERHPGLMTWFGRLVTLDSSCPLDEAHVPTLVACLDRYRREAGLSVLSPLAWRSLLLQGARFVESSRRISLAIDFYIDLIQEAHQHRAVADPVMHVLGLRRQGIAPIEDAIRRDVLEGLSLTALGGPTIGAVTALTLVEHHHFSLMLPARITATARQGDGKVIDIEREAELGGSSHTKGVMILCAWLSQSLSSTRPLSLTAHIACEQCHDPIDGDSASAGELAALVSAIAQVPLAQHLAVTGAVSQHGDLMAVGGINDKIEGHFRLMQAASRRPDRQTAMCTGTPGVVIPAANLAGLCLDQDVVVAIESGEYLLHAVARVEDMLEILAGLPWESDSVAGESLRQKALARLDTFDRSHRDDAGRSHWPRPLREK